MVRALDYGEKLSSRACQMLTEVVWLETCMRTSRERSNQDREHLLILRYPDGVLRVGRGDDLLLPVSDLLLRDEEGVRLLDRAVEVAHHPCRFDMRQDLRLPYQKVFPGELFGDGVAERCEGRGGHGDRGGGG